VAVSGRQLTLFATISPRLQALILLHTIAADGFHFTIDTHTQARRNRGHLAPART
jgi:hypothetical protein